MPERAAGWYGVCKSLRYMVLYSYEGESCKEKAAKNPKRMEKNCLT